MGKSTSKYDAIFYLIIGILFFIIFAIDIEKDRDIFTWLWLLYSILNLMKSLRYYIVYDREKK
jgi:hypothetical protein